MKYKRLNVVELYAGTGRSLEPFRSWRRCNVSLLVDNQRYAADTYKVNYPKAPYLVADLTHTSAAQIRNAAGGRVDVLLGCPPCQGFTDNTPRNPWDKRNRHLKNFARLAVDLRPLAIAMENVPLAGGGNAFKVFSKSIEQAGYFWTAGIINAALHGSCQCRQRLLFVAIRDDVGSEPVFPAPTHGGRRRYFNYNTCEMNTLREARNALLGIAPATFQVRASLPYREVDLGNTAIPRVGEVIEGLPEVGTRAATAMRHVPWEHSASQRRRMARIAEGGQPKRSASYYSQSYGRLHSSGLAKTITGAFPNAGSGRYWHPRENRSLTLREAARIQGFPDEFQFLPPFSHAAFLVGNALDQALASLSYETVRACLS
jgi:DNA (cytosine-5)-methyltransferase 1